MVDRFKTVYYHNIWYQGGFPSISPYFIGRGIEGINKVDNLFETLAFEQIDLVVFTDCYGNDLAEHLRELNFPCYSAGYGEELELDRIGLKELLEDKGLPVAKYEVAEGITDLKKKLKGKEDKYVKLAQPLRGVTETFHFIDMELSESEIDDVSNRLGCVKELVKFIIEDPIGTDETHVEFGYDGYTASGKFARKGMTGIEIKDVCYACKIVDWEELPEGIRAINEALADDFLQYNYKGQFHTEIKYGADKKPYLIDFTARNGFPPSELMYLMYNNMNGILKGTADNEVVEPETESDALYGIQIIIHSEWAEKNPQAVYIPDEIRDNVYLKNYVMVDGVINVIPQDYGLQEIGAVCGYGKTLDLAKKNALAICEKIRGIHLEYPTDKLDKVDSQIALMKKLNCNFF